MSQEYEYKMVGNDEQGNPLYQRVPKHIETEESQPDNVHNKPPIISKKDKSRKVERNSDFLYEGLDESWISLRHQQSVEHFPDLKMLEKEFVLKVITRHKIGIVAIWGTALIIALLLTLVWINVSLNNYSNNFGLVNQESALGDGSVIIALIMVMIALFAWIFTKVYRTNKLVITTERVVQYISNGLFDYKTQTIDLGWVEDVSYHRKGFLATLFNYGSVRLSTIGDESTYYFILTPKPDKTASELNDIVFAVKNEYPLVDKVL
ncbi:MAG: PH domain-containing protein [Candidatus Saccharibacteria bacterium]|nr:PH domain-containing protein [Candidatus Saccharibacteria bacterium]